MKKIGFQKGTLETDTEIQVEYHENVILASNNQI